jgi:hypothetical protein
LTDYFPLSKYHHLTIYYPLANKVAKRYSNYTVRPSFHNILVNTRFNILQWILTKLGTYLVLKRIWNLIDFLGQMSRSLGQIFRRGDTPRFALPLLSLSICWRGDNKLWDDDILIRGSNQSMLISFSPASFIHLTFCPRIPFYYSPVYINLIFNFIKNLSLPDISLHNCSLYCNKA